MVEQLVADYTDFAHTGPDTLTGRYLRMFWQPIYRTQDLPAGRSVPVELMNERFTLYRGEGGTPHLTAFRCAHRGTQLSTGWVEDDCIRCRYHGWKYDGTGQCVEQPGEDETFAAKIHIRSYAAEDYLGLIFVYIGEGDPPNLHAFSDFEEPGVLYNELPEYWPCNYFNRVDNACDIGHVVFTHSEAIRRARGNGEVMAHREERSWYSKETEYGIETSVQLPDRPVEYFQFHMPNANQNSESASLDRGSVRATRARGRRISWRVPVNDALTVSFSVNWFEFTEADAEEYRAFRRREEEELVNAFPPTDYADLILAGKTTEEDLDEQMTRAMLFSVEDYVTQVGQGSPWERPPERFGRIDQGVILLRNIFERELRALAEGRPLTRWTTLS